MNYYKGEDRILYIKQLGSWLPVACLSDNPFSETSEFINTTTRDNGGWNSSRPVSQSYTISFTGLQLNTASAGGIFEAVSYDKLKLIKRDRTLIDWKIEGNFPVVDYGKAYLQDLSESSLVNEFLTFSGSLIGFGMPKTTTKGTDVLNSGDPNEVVQSNLSGTEIIRTKAI